MKTIKNDLILFSVMLLIGLIGFIIVGGQFGGQDAVVDVSMSSARRSAIVDVSSSLQIAHTDTRSDTADIEFGNDAERQIESMLKNRANSWNNLNLKRYMADYRKFDSLRVSVNGKTEKGWEAVRDFHATKFHPEMGTIRISNIKIQLVGDFASIVTANWNLQQENKETKGRMNLVLKKIDAAWKITTENLTEN